ncbi:MAG: hypothetical protein QM756_29580 [Polyangiaceae bacterium]
MPEARTTQAAARALRHEPLVYTLTAAIVTLAVACRFYGSLRLQTLHALTWAQPSNFDKWLAEGRGPWSAPLDDVFIHFDFARSAARGHPFQWSEGNGYSSGGTSLLYPLVLALGYRAGLHGLELMQWAAIVACVSTLALLLGARRWTRELPRLASYLLPFGLLSIGALNWSLFSGMEVALFLALWVLAYIAYDDLLLYDGTDGPRDVQRRAALLGAASGLVAATRPEGITAVGVLTLAAVWHVWRRRGARSAIGVGVLASVPALLVLVAQSAANRYFTGETTAAGALVKLELHHPYLDARAVWDSWLFFIKYQVLRVTQYHFTDQAAYGWLAWAFALAALCFERTRRPALLLWATALAWVLMVATNGQVRWQNERYTMPAVAWLIGAACLGICALLTYAYEQRGRIRSGLIGGVTVGCVGLFLIHQAPRYREQLWFFGRAARNIFDQHVQAALVLRDQVSPQPKRVLVGDAGAIPYVSDLPALDIIGLGGYHGMPFARATRMHVGAALELIERLAPDDRPDMLALYPGWWGDFPSWFGHVVGSVPVRGNVVCGGAAKVLYRPDWSSLASSGRPFSLTAGERVLDSLDQADLISEREHDYHLAGAPGFVSMELIENPVDRQPLWDAGRTLPPPARESFTLNGDERVSRARLIVRAAPTQLVQLNVSVDGQPLGKLALTPRGGWVEASIESERLKARKLRVELGDSDHERLVYHVFLVAEP